MGIASFNAIINIATGVRYASPFIFPGLPGAPHLILLLSLPLVGALLDTVFTTPKGLPAGRPRVRGLYAVGILLAAIAFALILRLVLPETGFLSCITSAPGPIIVALRDSNSLFMTLIAVWAASAAWSPSLRQVVATAVYAAAAAFFASYSANSARSRP